MMLLAEFFQPLRRARRGRVEHAGFPAHGATCLGSSDDKMRACAHGGLAVALQRSSRPSTTRPGVGRRRCARSREPRSARRTRLSVAGCLRAGPRATASRSRRPPRGSRGAAPRRRAPRRAEDTAVVEPGASEGDRVRRCGAPKQSRPEIQAPGGVLNAAAASLERARGGDGRRRSCRIHGAGHNDQHRFLRGRRRDAASRPPPDGLRLRQPTIYTRPGAWASTSWWGGPSMPRGDARLRRTRTPYREGCVSLGETTERAGRAVSHRIPVLAEGRLSAGATCRQPSDFVTPRRLAPDPRRVGPRAITWPPASLARLQAVAGVGHMLASSSRVRAAIRLATFRLSGSRRASRFAGTYGTG
jgi:hypothetical protein